MSDRPCKSDLKIDRWATLTEGCNGAGLEFLSNRAAGSVIHRHQSNLQNNPIFTVNSIEITSSDFD